MWWLLAGCAFPGVDERPSHPPAEEESRDLDPDSASLALSDTGAMLAAEIRLTSDDPCENPCTLTVTASGGITAARYEADGWLLGTSTTETLELSYLFLSPGLREITVEGLSEAGATLATHTRSLTIADASSECPRYDANTADSAPVQTTGADVPDGARSLAWQIPTDSTAVGSFAGAVGSTASHEGIDYIHSDSGIASVSVRAAAAGSVAYVRTGCPQSAAFSSNQSVRECGAGWGNHIVVHHGGEIYTRYAHLKEDTTSVVVGDDVSAGQVLAEMGNSGRSEVRHLHFELGSAAAGFDPCASSQSFDTVHDPARLGL